MVRKDRGFAVWLTGLPSSGKSVAAAELSRLLARYGVFALILDSDELRPRLTPRPSYTEDERNWFYDIVVFLAELMTRNGVNVLIAATGSRQAYRDRARRQLRHFAEVHIDCPQQVCRSRDPKGLWRRAASGEIRTLPGAGTPYEAPVAPDLKVDTSTMTVEEAGRRIFDMLCQKEFFGPRPEPWEEPR
jgi:adenylylsulfate kinase